MKRIWNDFVGAMFKFYYNLLREKSLCIHFLRGNTLRIMPPSNKEPCWLWTNKLLKFRIQNEFSQNGLKRNLYYSKTKKLCHLNTMLGLESVLICFKNEKYFGDYNPLIVCCSRAHSFRTIPLTFLVEIVGFNPLAPDVPQWSHIQ